MLSKAAVCLAAGIVRLLGYDQSVSLDPTSDATQEAGQGTFD
jgi:hypothetical protein